MIKFQSCKKPCRYFQAQDHSESVPGKNEQSNICLSQVYVPKSRKQMIRPWSEKSSITVKEELGNLRLPHQSNKFYHQLPFQIHIWCPPISDHDPMLHAAMWRLVKTTEQWGIILSNCILQLRQYIHQKL